jgi:hypothetical protein
MVGAMHYFLSLSTVLQRGGVGNANDRQIAKVDFVIHCTNSYKPGGPELLVFSNPPCQTDRKSHLSSRFISFLLPAIVFIHQAVFGSLKPRCGHPPGPQVPFVDYPQ